MKRFLATSGIGLSLLAGVSAGLVVFPGAVGARTANPAASSLAPNVSGLRTLRDAMVTSRQLRDSVRAPARTLAGRHHTGRYATRGASTQRYSSATSATSATMYSTRYGTATGTATDTGRYAVYKRTAASGTGRTGHSCPGR
jgi:hypothetical protein